MLERAEPPVIGEMSVGVFNAFFDSFYTDDIEGAVREMSRKDLDVNEMSAFFRGMRRGVDVAYVDSYGAKIHDFIVRCAPEERRAVRECFVEVFGRFGIELEFE